MGIPFLNKKNPINEIECCGNKTRNPQTHNHVFDDLVTHIVKLIINDCVIKIKLYFKITKASKITVKIYIHPVKT